MTDATKKNGKRSEPTETKGREIRFETSVKTKTKFELSMKQ